MHRGHLPAPARRLPAALHSRRTSRRAGQDFLLAGRDHEAAAKLAAGLDGHAEVVSVGEAVERARVLVFAVGLDAFEQLIAQYGDRLAGKVIVDPTNAV